MSDTFARQSSRPRPNTSYVNQDLANAINDVVHISRNGSSQPIPTSSSHLGIAGVAGGQRRSPSPRMPGAFSHQHSQSTPESITDNPFDEGGLESSGHSDRQNSKDASESTPRSDRRQGSSSNRAPGEAAQLVEGQNKDHKNKKKSRHADVIDAWDPTGLGTAMWHHSGPYDAAAPSRNLNQPKAPVRAFNAPPAPSPPRTGPTAISLVPPPVPPKDEGGRRASSAARVPRRSSGGLSSQYSTSVPTSGGYFPDYVEEIETEDDPRKERLRQREEKQRALKAAWAEPFEDFATSPRDESFVDLGENIHSPELELTQSTSRGWRGDGVSPGTEDPFNSRASVSRPGGGVKRTKSLMQKIKSMVRRESEGEPPVPGSRSQSMSAAGDVQQQARRPSQAGWMDEPVLEEDESAGYTAAMVSSRGPPPAPVPVPVADEREGGRASSPNKRSPATEQPPPMPAFDIRRASQVSYTGRPSLSGSSGPASALASTNVSRGSPAKERPNAFEDAAEELHDTEPISPLPSDLINGGGGMHLAGGPLAGGPPAGVIGRKASMTKNLPLPPVKPVMPDFDDIVQHRRGSASAFVEAEPVTVKRKTSVVKKLKDRVAK